MRLVIFFPASAPPGRHNYTKKTSKPYRTVQDSATNTVKQTRKSTCFQVEKNTGSRLGFMLKILPNSLPQRISHFISTLWHDRINAKLFPSCPKSILYLYHQKRDNLKPSKKGTPDKEFSYGKQSLEVDCFYSGPFFFLSTPQSPHHTTPLHSATTACALDLRTSG